MKAGVRRASSHLIVSSGSNLLSSLLGNLRLIKVCVLLLLLMATGCALKANRGGVPPEAQAVIDTTTSDISEGRYEKIYNEAAEEWRQATTLDESNATFKSLSGKLGGVKGRSFHSASEQDTTSAHSFTITYKTSFERADGMETFTLVERNNRWLLARYFVNSDALK
jgi:hypothetical protein